MQTSNLGLRIANGILISQIICKQAKEGVSETALRGVWKLSKEEFDEAFNIMKSTGNLRKSLVNGTVMWYASDWFVRVCQPKDNSYGQEDI